MPWRSLTAGSTLGDDGHSSLLRSWAVVRAAELLIGWGPIGRGRPERWSPSSRLAAYRLVRRRISEHGCAVVAARHDPLLGRAGGRRTAAGPRTHHGPVMEVAASEDLRSAVATVAQRRWSSSRKCWASTPTSPLVVCSEGAAAACFGGAAVYGRSGVWGVRRNLVLPGAGDDRIRLS